MSIDCFIMNVTDSVQTTDVRRRSWVMLIQFTAVNVTSRSNGLSLSN